MKDINAQWKAEKEQIDTAVEELISYAGLREQIVNRLAKSKRSTDINLWEAMLAILDLSAVVVNGEGYESQEANEKLYYWLS